MGLRDLPIGNLPVMFRDAPTPVLFVIYLLGFGLASYFFMDHRSVLAATISGVLFAVVMSALHAWRLRHRRT
jgi:membrane associated rhomboid family serine protease